jgi:hypothetical protein
VLAVAFQIAAFRKLVFVCVTSVLFPRSAYDDDHEIFAGGAHLLSFESVA